MPTVIYLGGCIIDLQLGRAVLRVPHIDRALSPSPKAIAETYRQSSCGVAQLPQLQQPWKHDPRVHSPIMLLGLPLQHAQQVVVDAEGSIRPSMTTTDTHLKYLPSMMMNEWIDG